MAFKNYKKELEEHGQGSSYIKLADGDTIKVVIAGDEVTGPAHFDGKGYVPGDYADGTSRLRFAVPAYCDGGIKVLEGPETLFQELGAVGEDVDLESWLVSIKRVSNKKYEVRAIKQIDEGQRDKIHAMRYPDPYETVNWLKGCKKAKPVASAECAPVSDDDELPF
jgi:hypothetical protein